MKKISFIILCFLMLFFGFNVYASSNNEIEYEEYTGQAVSDDYKTEDNAVSTYGAIIVDPGLGGNSDDEFEMNDSFQTATDITNSISYNGYVGSFTKYLSIANHSNGNVDKDFFYFDNEYFCKTFSISITTDSFVKYNLQLYSVQGNEYVLVKSSDLGIAFTNFECGSFVLRLVFTNNTQASYKISINSEKTEYKANQAEVSATSLYDGLTKRFNVQSRNLYFKFYPNKSGQFTLDYNLNYIDSVEIYEYVTYDKFVSGTKKKAYNLKKYNTQIDLFQANMSANRKINPNSTTGYYVHLTAKKRGETYFKIEYKDITFYNSTKLDKNISKEMIYPMDDLSIFTNIYSESNIGSEICEKLRFDVLTEDFPSGDSNYDRVFGGINFVSLNDNNNSSRNHITISRFASLEYLYEDDTNDIYSVNVNYARIGLFEHVNGEEVYIYVVLLTNYFYCYDFDSNSLFLNSVEAPSIGLMDFNCFTYSHDNLKIYSSNFGFSNRSDTNAQFYTAVSDISKGDFESALGTLAGLSFTSNLVYNCYNSLGKIIYCLPRYNESGDMSEQSQVYDKLVKNTPDGAVIGCQSMLNNYRFSYNNVLSAKNIPSPYFPKVTDVSNYNSKDSFCNVSHNFTTESSILNGGLKYNFSYDIVFDSLNGNSYKFNQIVERGYFNE